MTHSTHPSGNRPKFCSECGARLPVEPGSTNCPHCDPELAGQATAIDIGATVQLPTTDNLSPAPTASDWAGQVIGDYEIEREIARGGMGVIYLARQKSLDRQVALKMILPGKLASQADIHRFFSEAQAAAGLDHPNIVPVYDMGEMQGTYFYSMAFVSGVSLAEHLHVTGLEHRQAAELIKVVAEALAVAHGQGVIHRDLKPANILIDEQGRPRVTDFGLAKRLQTDQQLTEAGQALGTPSYMPPEQAAGDIDRIGPTADIYSLGAILYVCLTGRPPFEAPSVFETLKQVVEREPTLPRDVNALVERDLEAICMKCLSKDPANRYETADQLAEELGRYLRDEPIQARPLSAWETLQHWRRMIRNNPDVRLRSRRRLGAWPLIDIAFGQDTLQGEASGHARGIIAVGDKASGVIAIGGNARGFMAYGLRATGVIAFGALAIGILPIGAVSLGVFPLGGVAVGGVAFGGLAAGYKATGLAAIGHEVFAAFRWVI